MLLNNGSLTGNGNLLPNIGSLTGGVCVTPYVLNLIPDSYVRLGRVCMTHNKDKNETTHSYTVNSTRWTTESSSPFALAYYSSFSNVTTSKSSVWINAMHESA